MGISSSFRRVFKATDPDPVKMGEFRQFADIVKGVTGGLTRAKAGPPDVYGIRPAKNGRFSAFQVFCRGKEFVRGFMSNKIFSH